MPTKTPLTSGNRKSCSPGRVAAVIVAAGEGKRFGAAKQFVLLAGKPVLEWAIEAFVFHPEIDEVVVVLPEARPAEAIKTKWAKVKAVVVGGKERQDSAARGLEAVSESIEIVLIHDGVRPLVKAELITKIIQAAQTYGAAIPALPLEDTTKEVEKQRVLRTLERERIMRVQTPQGFRRSLLQAGFNQAFQQGYYGPDEASLVERLGQEVVIVPGDKRNIKITTPEDIKIAEVWLNEGGYRL